MAKSIAFLIFDDFQLLDAAGPIAAFEMPVQGMRPPPYRLVVIAERGGLVRSSSGVALTAEPFDAVRKIDTLIVAGGQGTKQAMVSAPTLAFIRKQVKTARRVCSVCSGSLVLAAAGILDGKRATTHWRRCEQMRRTFPKITLESDPIFVRDGNIWTSAGVSAGIDLALALIGNDLGQDIAKRVAQELVVYHRRPGGQSQFSALLDLDASNERFMALLTWARENVDQHLTCERLADRIGMSPRSFARNFKTATGLTPAKAIERIRLEVARERVENGLDPIERIASKAGFGGAEHIRRAFIRAFGQPPQGMRRLARAKVPHAASVS
jgi:transcriptional regulator GlxA family with amidase domain